MKICVLGSGVMGTGIASLFALSGEVDSVVWWARSDEALDASYSKLKKEIVRFCRKSKLVHEKLDLFLDKVTLTTNLSDLSEGDFYIEAISEDLETKKSLFQSLSQYIPSDAVVASNTSSLSITALAMSTPNPQNFVGVHFFNPISMMSLVEIIKGVMTSEEVLEKTKNIALILSKSPVVVNESPGFIVNRMLIPMINEAVTILAEGVASKDDIDMAMKLGANHPIGPLALADLIGNDVCLSIMDTLNLETGDPKYRAHPLLRKYVRAGYVGRKSKRGFYAY